jgi:hypothetical protein
MIMSPTDAGNQASPIRAGNPRGRFGTAVRWASKQHNAPQFIRTLSEQKLQGIAIQLASPEFEYL